MAQWCRAAASIVGPALGGLIVATDGGATAAYVLNALAGATCMIVIGCIQASPQRRPALHEGEAGEAMLPALREGIRFVRRTPVLFAALSLAFIGRQSCFQ